MNEIILDQRRGEPMIIENVNMQGEFYISYAQRVNSYNNNYQRRFLPIIIIFNKSSVLEMKLNLLKGMVWPENFYPPLERAQKTCKNMYLGHFYQDWKWVQYSTACVT